MSYCRFSKDSEAYIYTTGYALHCFLSARSLSNHLDLTDKVFDFGDSLQDHLDALENAREFLLTVRETNKVMVPEYAIARIEKEIVDLKKSLNV